MSIKPEGWYMDPGPPAWDSEAKMFSFFLHKRDHESVLCLVAMDTLENAAQSSDLFGPALTRIFDAHRQLIELRAAQKLNAGQVESNNSVLVRAEDI
jgi:alkylhydroperoxidase family enzyme